MQYDLFFICIIVIQRHLALKYARIGEADDKALSSTENATLHLQPEQ